jgi:MoaA/NifB/PqqE/SkfB family radical SAM enzyme
MFLKRLDKKLYSNLVEKNTEFSKKIQEKKHQFIMAMLYNPLRNFDKGYISKKVAKKVINTLVKGNLIDQESNKKIRESFKEKYKLWPPSFIVLSPTQKCNLNCEGCYASSKANAPTLSFDVIDKICNEVYNEWGNRFMVISGGEPLIYNDNGKTLLDIFKKYKEMFFLFYTNGILIDKEMAKKLSELGNVTPAISIEGFEKETDERRGKGIFEKIMKVSENLKEAGVVFGVSVTATKKNIDTLLKDKFYDFIFQEFGASYMWLFHLMPIGKAKNTKELMISPKQRVELYRKWEELLRDKKYCIADFWNSGVLSNGCIAYGRAGGYLYVDWNGDIMPCVFIPYYEDNINDLYKKGKKLADSLFSELFTKGREWQRKYREGNKNRPDNWLMPCSIRDHWLNFKENILTEKSKPEDEDAREALKSADYGKTLEEFDEELERLTKPIWENEF